MYLTACDVLVLPISTNNSLVHRVKSRALVVTFSLPSTGPVTPEEYEAFQKFEEDLFDHKYSSCIGWVVKQREEFLNGGKAFTDHVHKKLTEIQLTDVVKRKVRNTCGWTSCLFFVNQVCVYSIHPFVKTLSTEEMPKRITTHCNVHQIDPYTQHCFGPCTIIEVDGRSIPNRAYACTFIHSYVLHAR